MVNKYICGLCKNKKQRFVSTRKGLRNHFKEEHSIMKQITNSDTSRAKIKQDWWITEEWQ